LPSAWTDFLNDSTHGASCLGPLSGLADKKEIYETTVAALTNPKQTTLFLVSRPEDSALYEAARASKELAEVGINNQSILLNGVLMEHIYNDDVSQAFWEKQQKALVSLPSILSHRQLFEIPLVPYSLTGIQSLRQFFLHSDKYPLTINESAINDLELPRINELIEDLDKRNIKVIFTMGKGGVGKTTVASALALGLAEKGRKVLLTTTDPASHLLEQFAEKVIPDLTIGRIDPKVEVENYRHEVLGKLSDRLDDHSIAYLKEDLESPCTEEIAIFRAFADVVAKSNKEIVVIDTAPTGHTLLLLDAAHSYHKELERATGEVPESVKQLLPRLRNPNETEVVIVTLAEATPVFEASRLQNDLRRAQIKPNWWVINQSFYATETKDPVLRGRAVSERAWILQVQEQLANQVAVIPWQQESL
jgi:arsenite-transporting ATPase